MNLNFGNLFEQYLPTEIESLFTKNFRSVEGLIEVLSTDTVESYKIQESMKYARGLKSPCYLNYGFQSMKENCDLQYFKDGLNLSFKDETIVEEDIYLEDLSSDSDNFEPEFLELTSTHTIVYGKVVDYLVDNTVPVKIENLDACKKGTSAGVALISFEMNTELEEIFSKLHSEFDAEFIIENRGYIKYPVTYLK